MASRASQASSAVSSTLTGRAAETFGEGNDGAACRDESMEGKYCIVTGSNSGIGEYYMAQSQRPSIHDEHVRYSTEIPSIESPGKEKQIN